MSLTSGNHYFAWRRLLAPLSLAPCSSLRLGALSQVGTTPVVCSAAAAVPVGNVPEFLVDRLEYYSCIYQKDHERLPGNPRKAWQIGKTATTWWGLRSIGTRDHSNKLPTRSWVSVKFKAPESVELGHTGIILDGGTPAVVAFAQTPASASGGAQTVSPWHSSCDFSLSAIDAAC